MTYHNPQFMRSYSSGILHMLHGLKQINDGLKSLSHYQVGLVQMNVHNKIEILLGEAKHILQHAEHNPDLDDLREFRTIVSLQILIKIKDLENYQIQLGKVIDHFTAINHKAHEQILATEARERDQLHMFLDNILTNDQTLSDWTTNDIAIYVRNYCCDFEDVTDENLIIFIEDWKKK